MYIMVLLLAVCFLVFLVISTKLCYSLVAAHRYALYTSVSLETTDR